MEFEKNKLLDQVIEFQKTKSWHMIALQDEVRKISWADGWTPSNFESQFNDLIWERNASIRTGFYDENGQIAPGFNHPEWLRDHKTIEMSMSSIHEVWKEKFPDHYSNHMALWGKEYAKLPCPFKTINLSNKAIILSTGKEGCPIAFIARFDEYRYFDRNEKPYVTITQSDNPDIPYEEVNGCLAFYDDYDTSFGSSQKKTKFWLNEFASWCCLREIYGDVALARGDGDYIKLLRLWNVLQIAASDWGKKEKNNSSYVTFQEVIPDPVLYDLTGVLEWHRKNKRKFLADRKVDDDVDSDDVDSDDADSDDVDDDDIDDD